jgi:hypothetical protein
VTVTDVVCGTGPPSVLVQFEQVVSSETLALVSLCTALVLASDANAAVHAAAKHPFGHVVIVVAN